MNEKKKHVGFENALKSAKELCELGVRELKKKSESSNYENALVAITFFDKAMEKMAKFGIVKPEIVFLRSKCLFQLERYQECEKEMKKAIKGMKKWDFFLLRGRAMLQMGEIIKGIKCFNKGLEIDKKAPKLLYERGKCFFEMKEYRKCNEDMKCCYEQLSNSIKMKFKASFTEEQHHSIGFLSISESENYFSMKERKRKFFVFCVLYYKAVSHFKINDFQSAITDLRQCLSFNLNSVADFLHKIHNYMGLIYLYSSDMNNAFDSFQKSLNCLNGTTINSNNIFLNYGINSSNNSSNNNNINNNNSNNNNSNSSSADFSEKVNIFKSKVLKNKALAYFGLKLYHESITDFSKAIQILQLAYSKKKSESLDKKLSMCYCFRGNSFAAEDDFENALKDFTISEEKNNKLNENVYFFKAKCFQKMNQNEKAKESFFKALEINPNHSFSLLELGKFFFNKKMLNEADEFLSKAKEAEKSKKIFRNRFLFEDNNESVEGKIFEMKGRTDLMLDKMDSAVSNFEKAIALSSKSPKGELFYFSGLSLLGSGRYEDAIILFNKAYDSKFEKKSEIFNQKANCYRKLHKIKEANDQINKAIECDDKNEDFYLSRSSYLEEDKKYFHALDDLNEAIEILTMKKNFKKIKNFYFHRGKLNFIVKNFKTSIVDFKKSIKIAKKLENKNIQNNKNNNNKNNNEIDEDDSFEELMENCYLMIGLAFENLFLYEKANQSYSLGINLIEGGLSLSEEENKKFKEEKINKIIEFYHRRGKCYHFMKKYFLSLQDYNKVISESENYSRNDILALMYYERAFVYKALSKFEESASDFLTAQKLDINNSSDSSSNVPYSRFFFAGFKSLKNVDFLDVNLKFDSPKTI